MNYALDYQPLSDYSALQGNVENVYIKVQPFFRGCSH